MTKAEKYPNSVEAILQREARNLVREVWYLYSVSSCDEYIFKVQIRPEIWNGLNTKQKDYLSSLLGGSWYIVPLNDRPGIWLCVRRECVCGFHYNTPQRVHPVRVYK